MPLPEYMSEYSTYFLFIVLFISLFITRQWIVQKLYLLFYLLTRSHRTALYCVAVLFFPGTVVHEMAHAVSAMVLHLHVTSITLIPHIHHNGVVLGSVEYYRKDRLRSIAVGIAPVVVGLCFVYISGSVGTLPFNSVVWNSVYLYCMYVVISSMFSSKQDLKDVGYVVPLLILILIVVIIFRIPVIDWMSRGAHSKTLIQLVSTVNTQLLFICGANVALMILYLVISRTLQKS